MQESTRHIESGNPSFYSVSAAPVNSVLLLRSQEEAENIRHGEISLSLNTKTGLISNTLFDQNLVQYSDDYEETQGFSPTFNAFHERLARDLIERFDLRGKKVVEIGCGKGEFLSLLCEIGGNDGVGFDPAYRPERNTSSARTRMRFVQDFYSEAYAPLTADFLCCKMTLEHIPDVFEFVNMIRRSLEANAETTVFFQVPDVRRILRDIAFWDIYYEHCSYFSEESLRSLFESAGFDVMQTWTDYDDQYLMIEAKPARSNTGSKKLSSPSFDRLKADVAYFAEQIDVRLNAWQTYLDESSERGESIVLWGGGSKAVSFLTTLRSSGCVLGAVDINPHKHGTFLAGTGLPILSPADLLKQPPDSIVIMNPVYEDEIRRDLAEMGLHPNILNIDFHPEYVNKTDVPI